MMGLRMTTFLALFCGCLSIYSPSMALDKLSKSYNVIQPLDTHDRCELNCSKCDTIKFRSTCINECARKKNHVSKCLATEISKTKPVSSEDRGTYRYSLVRWQVAKDLPKIDYYLGLTMVLPDNVKAKFAEKGISEELYLKSSPSSREVKDVSLALYLVTSKLLEDYQAFSMEKGKKRDKEQVKASLEATLKKRDGIINNFWLNKMERSERSRKKLQAETGDFLNAVKNTYMFMENLKAKR